MKNYHDLLQRILDEGYWQENRTGVRTKAISGAMLRFDLAEGFPAITTKKLAFKSVVGELVGFLRGVTSAAAFRELGCKVWDQNANENAAWLANPFRKGVDSLGNVYGAQWRRWEAARYGVVTEAQRQAFEADGWEEWTRDLDNDASVFRKTIDQLAECLGKLMHNPSDRRILFHGWNPAELNAIALPACHILYIFNADVARRELSMTVTLRSWDTFLGGPFNIAESAALLALFAHLSGFKPRFLTVFSADTHIYENHVEQVRELLVREPFPAPTLSIADRVPRYDGTNAAEIVSWLDRVEPGDFVLSGYRSHEALKAPMAV